MTINKICWALGVVAGVAGVVVAARAIFGPFPLIVQVSSPLTAEGWFGIAVVLLFLLRSSPAGTPPADAPVENRGRDAILAASVAFLALAAFAANRNDYFLSDDFYIMRLARDFRADASMWFSARGGSDGFFRPFTFFSYWLTAQASGASPFVWHLPELLLHAANSALTYVVARQMRMARAAAWFAAALFALHGSRPEAVIWISSRFDLQSTLFVLIAVIFFLLSLERRGLGRVLFSGFALLAMACGMLSKEVAYAGPLLLALLLILRRDGEKWTARASILAPYFVLAAVLFVARWEVLGGIGGYRTAAGTAQILNLRPLALLKTLLHREWAILFFPLDWEIEPGAAAGIAMLVFVPAVLWLAWRHADRRQVLAALGWVVLASLPALPMMLVGADLERSRYFYLPSVGWCLLLGAAVGSAGAMARRGMVTAAACAAVLVFEAAALGHNLTIWKQVSNRALPACTAPAACPRRGRILATGIPRLLHGVYFFQNGFQACMVLQGKRSPDDIDMRDTPPTREDPSRYACILSWDSSREELLRVNPR